MGAAACGSAGMTNQLCDKFTDLSLLLSAPEQHACWTHTHLTTSEETIICMRLLSPEGLQSIKLEAAGSLVQKSGFQDLDQVVLPGSA